MNTYRWNLKYFEKRGKREREGTYHYQYSPGFSWREVKVKILALLHLFGVCGNWTQIFCCDFIRLIASEVATKLIVHSLLLWDEIPSVGVSGFFFSCFLFLRRKNKTERKEKKKKKKKDGKKRLLAGPHVSRVRPNSLCSAYGPII